MVLGARLRELASEFNNQYRITYEGTRPAKVDVGKPSLRSPFG